MGFYYDEQLNNRSYTVRLYGDGDGHGDYPNLIAKSIWTENFEFATSNTWNNFESVGNPLESIWNQANKFSGFAKPIVETIQKLPQVNSESTAGQAINRFVNWSKRNGNTLLEKMNSHLVVQGTRFVYFGGSSINMSNLSMRYTIMYDPSAPKGQRTVRDQLNILMPYCIGKYETLKEVMGKEGDGQGILSLLGWQTPPGGIVPFTAGWKNVDAQGKGTLKLVFGGNGFIGSSGSTDSGDFEIDNLVVKDWNVSLSRVSVKGETERTPLYADVTLTFDLAGYITRDKLKQFLKLPSDMPNKR